MKKFLLSDESLNSYGFRVLTEGINIDGFLRNPVMYYNHDRDSGVIGKWGNVMKKDTRLLGAPVFDQKDPLGAKIAGKVKDGFIKGASIGIDNVKFEEINGETVVTSCILKECSVCDIPSNENALMLYHEDKPVSTRDEYLKLYKKQSIMNLNLKPITDVLGISKDASVDDIVAGILILKNQGGAKALIEQYVKSGVIARHERSELIEMAAASPDALQRYLQKRKELAHNEREENGLKLINEAIRDGRVNGGLDGKVKSFWLKNFIEDFENTKIALEHLPKPARLKDFIDESRQETEDRSGWTLSDYRKKAPAELKKNPNLYTELLEREKK